MLSIVIPCRNAAAELRQCLAALASSNPANAEFIVVDDASTDNSADVALESTLPVRLVTAGHRRGSAAARNAGAGAASGDVLVFLDADVCVHRETLASIETAFETDPGLGALMGAYDDAPAAPGFYSQYRNLQHCYVHRSGAGRAVTFWTGCGAIRTSLFFEHGGFDESPNMVDDIELGGCLACTGVRIELRPELQVKHLKGWTLWSTVRTDIGLRGIPWMLLILRDGQMPNVLNVNYRCRASVALAGMAAASASLAVLRPGWALLLTTFSVLAAVWLNRGFYEFLRKRRGAWFAMRGVGAHLLHLFSCGVSFVEACAWFAVSSPVPRTSIRSTAAVTGSEL